MIQTEAQRKAIQKYRQTIKYRMSIKKYQQSEKGKLYAIKHRLKTRYGLTEEQYNTMLDEQHSACAICDTHQSLLNKKLCVDHDHITGKVRGLLCDACNVGLSRFKDNIDIIFNAINYLKKGKGK